jgi:molybdopterin-synthase adenylyltransferase
MSERYSRNQALFGVEGQRRITERRVAIVGLGGLGSHLAQQLAYLGVRRFVLVDYDQVTESSLNRLVGASPSDVGTPKVEVSSRLVASIQPGAETLSLNARVDEPSVHQAIAGVDVVFAGLDRDLPRLQLTEICASHAKPYFDLASDTGGEGKELWFGGRVVFSEGSRCLYCLGLLDQNEISHDQMSPEQREANAEIYGLDNDSLGRTGPAVVSVNATVASLAVTEFMLWVTGLAEPASQLSYYGQDRAIRRSTDIGDPNCPYCSDLSGQQARASETP